MGTVGLEKILHHLMLLRMPLLFVHLCLKSYIDIYIVATCFQNKTKKATMSNEVGEGHLEETLRIAFEVIF